MALLKWFDNIHIYCVCWANCYILETDSSGIILAFSGFFCKSRLLCSSGRERERERERVCVCVFLSVVSNSSQGLCFYGSVCVCMCMCACVWTALSVMSTPVDCSSSVGEIFQARILEQVAFSFFRESSLPRDQTHVSCIERRVLYQQNHQGSSLYAIIFFFLPICPRTGIFCLSACLFH